LDLLFPLETIHDPQQSRFCLLEDHSVHQFRHVFLVDVFLIVISGKHDNHSPFLEFPVIEPALHGETGAEQPHPLQSQFTGPFASHFDNTYERDRRDGLQIIKNEMRSIGSQNTKVRTRPGQPVYFPFEVLNSFR